MPIISFFEDEEILNRTIEKLKLADHEEMYDEEGRELIRNLTLKLQSATKE